MKFLHGFILALFVAIYLVYPAVASSDALKAPWGVEKKAAHFNHPPGADLSWLASSLIKAIDLFQNFISPVDGPRSRHYPTSSAFSRGAIAKHGALLGFLLTVDRLIHEFIPSKTSPVVYIGGVPRFYDPIEANDFWFLHGGKDAAR